MKNASRNILVVDFGSQVTQLIARRVREAGVYCEVHPFNNIEDKLDALDPAGIILSGGPASVLDENAPGLHPAILQRNIPIFGICYGQQILCKVLGGVVEADGAREFGRADIVVKKACPVFEGVWAKDTRHQVWMSHGDRVTEIPEGFDVLASSEGAPFAMIGNVERNIYATQFHPEVVHTPDGARLLSNFVHKVTGCDDSWTMAAYRQLAVDRIRKQVGSSRVICGLSGGVDSSVAALLLHEAVGNQLTCIFVDHGLLRMGEAEEVVSLFRTHYNIPLVHVDAGNRFLTALEGRADPEEKRKIIGRLFVEIFEEEAGKAGGADFLAQGTLYPDVIESVSVTGGPSVTIKSHHNVGGLPEKMKLALVEPLRDLFKDEVRDLGRELGLPDLFVDRHPFPGPGLAIRCPGEVTKSKADILRQADAIYLDEIRASGQYDRIWQAFAVLLPVQAVGVMGDSRTYDYSCVLRAVTSVDGMTADFYPFEMDFLGRTATRIINEVRGISRVLYDVTSKPPGTIEWE